MIINKLPTKLNKKKFLEIKKTLFNLPKALLGFLDDPKFTNKKIYGHDQKGRQPGAGIQFIVDGVFYKLPGSNWMLGTRIF